MVISKFNSELANKKSGRIIRILLADDHPLIRNALREVFNRRDDFEIVAEACDGEEVIALASELMPDIVVMDISMPKINGIEATRILKKTLPDVAIVVLTIHDDSDHVFSILEAGADAYLTKQVFGDEVIHVVYGVANGETILASKSSKELLKEALNRINKSLPAQRAVGSGLEEVLSNRDVCILRLLASGMSNKNIADRLHLSDLTVKNYLVQIFNKLNVSSRTEAVITVLKTGIVSLDEVT